MSASSYFSSRFPCRRLRLRGGRILLGTCSLCRQSMQSLNCSNSSSAVALHYEGAFDGRPDSCRRAACAAADGGCPTGTVAPGAGTREACGVEDATPSVISTSSTRTMEMGKR